MGRAAIDSRDYIVAFLLYSPDDCPPDFELDSCLRDFEVGLFLPRDDPDWFGRSSYPPRILLLRHGQLTILSHPAVEEGVWQCRLSDLISVESGHMLLKGWLRFAGNGFDRTIRYNTRGYRSVLLFIQRFREAWLGKSVSVGLDSPVKRPAELTMKFDEALAIELDPDESVRAYFYEPPREISFRKWLFRRRTDTPGDLLVLTDRRLIWITDRDRGSRAPYGTVTLSSPLDAWIAVSVPSAGTCAALAVAFAFGCRWHVPLAASRQADAEAFAAQASQDRNRHVLGPAQLRS
jgi:hypothetical protein